MLGDQSLFGTPEDTSDWSLTFSKVKGEGGGRRFVLDILEGRKAGKGENGWRDKSSKSSTKNKNSTNRYSLTCSQQGATSEPVDSICANFAANPSVEGVCVWHRSDAKMSTMAEGLERCNGFLGPKMVCGEQLSVVPQTAVISSAELRPRVCSQWCSASPTLRPRMRTQEWPAISVVRGECRVSLLMWQCKWHKRWSRFHRIFNSPRARTFQQEFQRCSKPHYRHHDPLIKILHCG